MVLIFTKRSTCHGQPPLMMNKGLSEIPVRMGYLKLGCVYLFPGKQLAPEN
jgi:hypothetical protein